MGRGGSVAKTFHDSKKCRGRRARRRYLARGSRGRVQVNLLNIVLNLLDLLVNLDLNITAKNLGNLAGPLF